MANRLRNTFFLFLFLTFQLPGNSQQGDSITLHYVKVPLINILLDIEKKTNYRFFYSNDQIPLGQKISVHADAKPFPEALRLVFNKTGIQYKIVKQQIVLTPSKGLLRIPIDFLTGKIDTIQSRSGLKSIGTESSRRIVLEGWVGDITTGEAIPGANVVVVGTSIGTLTQQDGNFSISSVNPFSELQVSCVGYQAVLMPVQGRKKIDIWLEPEIKPIDAVVVIGYGQARLADFTGSVSHIKSEDLMKSEASTLEKALGARVPGVLVVQTTGKPGENASVRIRGMGSINMNPDPLFVIDGIITDQISLINPQDIENIEILKDAAAAAIYGTNGSNGVVLVTTKRGRSGKTYLQYSSSMIMNLRPKKLEVMNANQYADFYNAILAEKGIFQAAYSKNFRQKYYGNGWERGTDWQEAISKNALKNNHYLNVAGGIRDYGNFSISANYNNEDGILVNTSASRASLTTNSDFKAGKYIRVGESFSFGRLQYRDIGSQTGNPWYVSAIASPLMKIRNNANKGGFEGPQIAFEYSPGEFYPNTGGNDKTNPLAELEIPVFRRYINSALGNFYTEVKPFNWFSFRTTFGFELSNQRVKNWLPAYDLGVRSNNRASLHEEFSDYVGLSIDNQLTFSGSIGKHDINAILVHHARGSENNLIGGTGFNFRYENLNVLDQSDASGRQLNGGSYTYRALSYLARIMYSYAGKYYLTTSIRRDGVSRFRPGRRFGNFPAFSFAWKINEDFLRNISWIDLLKLKSGWGMTGNSNVIDFQYGEFLDNTSQFSPVFGADQKLVPGMYLFYSFANPEIRWEAARTVNVGIEFSAWKGKIEGSAEYYVKNQNDLLVKVPISDIFGRSGDQSEPWVNAGKLQNRGLDFSITFRAAKGGFRYSFTAQLSTFMNKVKYLPQQEIVNSDNSTITIKNHSIGSLYGFIATRIITEDDFDRNGNYLHALPSSGKPSPGDIMFVDLNRDGIINDLDRTIIGKAIPDGMASLIFNSEINRFDIYFLINGIWNFDIFNAQRSKLMSFDSQDMNHNKLAEYAQNYYRSGHPSDKYLRADLNNMNQNDRISTWWIENGSYLRFKEIQLGYTLQKRTNNLDNNSIIRLYASASNLFTITRYKGRDPEGALSSSPLNSGVDRGIYPIPRSIGIGVQVRF